MNKKITKFEQSVYEACLRIPFGRVATYSDVAVYIKRPNSQRAVGNALHHNPDAPHIPCHRVVTKHGLLGGFAGGIKKKIRLLRSEGVAVKNNKLCDFTKVWFNINA